MDNPLLKNSGYTMCHLKLDGFQHGRKQEVVRSNDGVSQVSRFQNHCIHVLVKIITLGMVIREALESDIPSIVNLLKISLGETLMPKSEDFWRWKHINNPFGRSPVLLAFEEEKLIGVRAFMRWDWTRGAEIIKTVRAVDTATHPDHQGKGIFRKLTLQLVDQCRAEGIQFIFNSPNKMSKAGYLKMGWETLGRMRLFIKPIANLKNKCAQTKSEFNVANVKGTIQNFDSNTLLTNPAISFLEWRYGSNPNILYNCFQGGVSDTQYLTIYRLKPFRFGVEFRICGEFKNSRVNEVDYKKHLVDTVKQSGSNIVTSSVALPGLSVGLNRGPEITIRKLTSNPGSITFSNWSPTLGDMEVF